ncbi:NAD(P)/FAD-dependent oxidoreductase [Pseudosulfitobacter pseudonitzschiae]|uniref:NAD(P)/FAD-dependent oxidoreductase n=1 Tax=Pseudosulfitobacter pseudonitzschiae TaxID=1402135 RepID=UPI001AFACD3C|nr:FAD-binding oxidoreductase [Pseudosulfitobacter pseudonitzschiae]MBM1816018.1 FAD-binding oxidoreductase [Pseudosulfitobacter pseudonitzschiae]MBM1833324.1 FAD-binding oxidoreductase [Pseudosulfitobacter pseudonitzschiae]MBM1838191.1 FAD-binding oxidoreductase [Pseudosulfitobacter pseudonitzschiae]MBM1842723.1 FAD-binding oxidoreductase [Pseudosulfitobacter pseudonitzschiae]MBM1847589.1 FAD-binding oxidoreductase [Pseudosulfitobacter pseudonitzschiae]
MPGPKLDPVVSDSALPSSVDVVIIGGGIAGVCTALELADRGLKVAICEKGQIGGEQSSRNWGWVRLTHRDPRELPLMIEAVKIWEGLDKRIAGKTGYSQCGSTYAIASDAALQAERKAQEELRGYQIPTHLMNREEALTHLQGYDPDAQGLIGALHCPRDGRAEPQMAAPAIARAVQDRGGTVHQNCAVRVVETSAGKVSGVVTERGRIACDAVLVAGGVWSRLFLRNIGIYLPQLRTRNTVLRTDAVEAGPQSNLKTTSFAIRKRMDGGYTVASAVPSRYQLTPDSFRLFTAYLPTLKNEWRSIRLGLGPAFLDALRTPRHWTGDDVSPFEKTRILDPEADAPYIDKTLAVVKKTFPALKDATVAQRWGGYIDVLPDLIPAISTTEGVKNGIPGLFVATGFSGHGFGLGTGAGRLAAELITGQSPVVDPTPFRLHRFTDGTKISPIPVITTPQ